MDLRGYYSTTDAAQELHLSRQRVLQLGDEGELVGEKDSEDKWKWSRESVDELVEERAGRRERKKEDREQRESRNRQRRWELGRELAAEKSRRQEESDERRELARRFVTAVETIAKELACKQ